MTVSQYESDAPPSTIPSPPSTGELKAEPTLGDVMKRIDASEAKLERLVENQTIALIEVIDERFVALATGLELEREARRRGVEIALAAAKKVNGANGKGTGDGDSGPPDADS